MDFTALLYAFGLSGFFSSRAFLPAFATALALKYGDHLPWLGQLEFLRKSADTPLWITNDWVVLALGLLALVELVGEKSPEARELLDEGLVYVKTAIAAATSFGLLSATDAAAAAGLLTHASAVDLAPAAAAGGLTYYLSRIRQGIARMLTETDNDDALGVRGVLSWGEELWTVVGVWMLLLAPVAMVAILAAVFGFLWLLQKRYERKQELAKIECASCQTRIHSFATGCHQCGRPVEKPRRLGFLGRTLAETEPDQEAQKLRLLEFRRSPLSGDRAEGRGVDVVCATDQVQLLGDPALTRRYVQTVDARLLKVLLFCAVASLVPVIGLIVGVVYYRFQLVAPFRRYLRFGKGFVARCLVRLLFLLLVLLQFVPVLGAIAVPLMAFINYSFYRSAFLSSLRESGLLRD